MSQSHDLHRALLRPAIIHTLRAAGFHSTRPSVLDTLTNLAERHLLLCAATTAAHAANAHNDPRPTISDVRTALTACGVLTPAAGAAEEEWAELMREPLGEVEARAERMGMGKGGGAGARRVAAERRRRAERDLLDVEGLRGC